MKVVASQFSYRSCPNMNSLSVSMFLDSPIANLFRCQKPSALITLAWFSMIWLRKNAQKVKASAAHSILFDENLNHNLQDEEIDFQIHFWEK